MLYRTAFNLIKPSRYYSVLYRIHPLMQELVSKILDALASYDVKLIVFGSSVTYACNSLVT